MPERGGIRTVAADPAKLEDPSLIIYNPVLTLGKTHIVTNGDQTDTIAAVYDLMSSRARALKMPCAPAPLRPTAPNYTPRISGVVVCVDGSYKLSILKSATATPPACSARSLITRSPWQARAISSAPTSTTAPHPQLCR